MMLDTEESSADLVMSVGEKVSIYSKAQGDFIVVTATADGLEVQRDG